VQPGEDVVSDPVPLSAAPTQAWWFLNGIDVVAPEHVGAAVTLGDSITDGFQMLENGSYLATLHKNERYPDYLTRRIIKTGLPLSVLNAGISGNRVLSDGDGEGLLLGYGPSAVNRLNADVIGQAGVTDVILMEGTNDIAGGRPPPRSSAGWHSS
jgi:lysophospholipase L1-like esterase